MPSADSKIKLKVDVDLDNRSIKQSSNDLSKALTDEIAKLSALRGKVMQQLTTGISGAMFSPFSDIIEDLDARVGQVLNTAQELTDVRVPSQEWESLNSHLQACNSLLSEQEVRLSAIKNHIANLDKDGVIQNIGESLRADGMEESVIDVITGAMQELDFGAENVVQSLSDKLTALGVDADMVKGITQTLANSNVFIPFQVAESKLASTEADLAELRQDISETEMAIIELIETGRDTSSVLDFEGADETVDAIVDSMGQLSNELEDIGPELQGVISDKLSSGFGKLGNGIKGVLGKLPSLSSLFGKASGAVGKFGNKLTIGFKQMLQFSLGFTTIMAGLRKLSQFIQQGFGNLSQYMTSVFSNMESVFASTTDATLDVASAVKSAGDEYMYFKDGIEYAKNAVAAAVQPLVSYVMPVLNTLINLFGQATEAVARFFATLTGQNFIVKATRKQQGYADAIESTSGAMDDMLGKYDKLNVIQQSSGGGAGGAGSGVGDMFESQELGEPSKLAQMFKDAWAKADFTDVGRLIGNKFTEMLNKIPWTDIQNTAIRLASSIVTGINGFFDGTDWGVVGHTIAQGLNTAIYFAFTIVSKLDFKKIGKSIGETINRVIQETDWHTLGVTIHDAIAGVLDLASSLLDEVDFEAVGNAIGELLSGIDFQDLLKKALKLSIKLGKALIETFKGSFETAPIETTLLSLFALCKFTPIGTFIGKKILDGIVTKLTTSQGTATLATTGLGTAFSEALTSLGGIGGLMSMDIGTILGAGTLAEIGIMVGTAIIGGIIASILGWNIGQLLYEAITGEDIDASFTEQMSYLFGASGEEIGTAFKDMFVESMEAIVYLEDTAWDWFKGIGQSALDGLKSGIDKIKDLPKWVAEQFDEHIVKPVKEKFGIDSNSSTVFSDIGKALIDGLFDGISNTWDKVKQFFDESWKTIKDLFGDVAGWFKETFGDAWQGIVDIFDTGGDVFNSITNGILDTFKEVVNGIIGGLNDVITIPFDGINSALRFLRELDIPVIGSPFSNLPNITVPQIPYLAQGAVIPANAPFLAMLGDQRSGTNIEAPLDTIKQAVAEVIATSDSGSKAPIILQVNGKTLAKVVWDENQKKYKQTGTYNFA